MVECQLPKLKVASSSLVARSNNQLLRFITITLAILTSAFAAVAQTPISDAEMREIVRLLLEREVPRSTDRSDVVVLLGPNTKSGWIPQIAGMAIKKLDYEEQKLVSEFYDLSSSVKGNVIEIALMKGNYCKKIGRRYQFRRRAGTWEPKEIGFAESTTMGTNCDGCAVGSGAVYSVWHQFPPGPTSTPTERRDEQLILNGVVNKVSCSKDDGSYTKCNVDLKLKFTNVALTPVILLKPSEELELWQGGTTLALSEKDSRMHSFVYNFSAWPSVYRWPLYRNLADLLDKPTPPDKLTRILSPGESWGWDTSIGLRFLESNSCNQHVGVEIGWKEVKKLPTPLWLRVSYEMWPFNVENFKPNLGGDLKRRWQRHGSLYLNDKEGTYWHAILTSEPIELNLSGVELSTSGAPVQKPN